jgi:hypothetical protein
MKRVVSLVTETKLTEDKTMTTATKTKDAIALLKEDHKEVKALFDKFEKADEEEQKEIAEEAMKALRVHAVVEEEIFYPTVRAAIEESDIMDESEEEHRVAKTLIEELENGKNADEHFEAKFIVLAENIRHHIKEEEGEMFKQARETDIDMKELGEQMMARKEELMADEEALLAAEAKTKVKPYQELA